MHRENILKKRKGNIPPEAHGDAKWRGARVALDLEGDKCEVGREGGDVTGAGQLGSGARSWYLL